MDKKNRFEMGIKKPNEVRIEVDGESVVAYEGETIAAALIASGKKAFGRTMKSGKPRGIYCGIGNCHECRVTVDDVADVLACQTVVRAGCKVETQK